MKSQALQSPFRGWESIEIPTLRSSASAATTESVVEIAPLETSEVNKLQKRPTKNHKDLGVGNLVPNRILRLIRLKALGPGC